MNVAAAARILVVDDDEAGRYLKSHVLAGFGHEVLTAASGAEALGLVVSEGPAVVLLDVKLPDMSGIDVCRRIKSEHPEILVLQTSAAFTAARDRVAGLAGGADSYLIEPIEPDELVATVNALLRMHRAEQELRQLNDTLELRVTERTSALVEANRQLAAESEQRARAEEALRHVQKLDALGQLTGGVAHDFNNLLTVILGNLEMVEGGLAPERRLESETLRRLVGSAVRAAQGCERLTRQLLAFARRDSLRLEIVDVNDAISKFETLLDRALGEDIRLELQLAGDLWACRVDVGRLEAAILNLGVNARDAMAQGGTLRIATANVELGEPGPLAPLPGTLTTEAAAGAYVRIDVSDTGTGMSGETLSRAFEPFFTTKDVGQGSGLGLSQVYGFVRQSGGHLTVRTEERVGTMFSLFLPRDIGSPNRRRALAADEVPQGGNETILLVEDNESVLEIAAEIMTELGYRVLCATDGRAALEILRSDEPVDLLFTDVVMPNSMNGMELAQAAREQRLDLKILMTSGYSARDARTAQTQPSFPLLPKPYRRAELAKRLREALAG